MKFEDRSHEETERQQRCARSKACNLAKEHLQARRASVHMVSKRDLNSAELETMRTSRSPTKAMTAFGEVQTREEATVFVKELIELIRHGYAS